MALGDPYASVAELEARLGKSDDGTFAAKLDVASRDVELFTHRQFNKTEVATARTFRPIDGCSTVVDDFHTITGLIIATDDDNDGVFESTWTATQFELAPADGVVSGVSGWPFWQIIAVSSRYFHCRRRSNVRVTAQWGWNAVPAAIKEATLAVAEQTVSKSTGPVRSEAIDGYSVSYGFGFGSGSDQEVLGSIAPAGPYRRFEGFA